MVVSNHTNDHLQNGHPVGENQASAFRASFNRAIRIESRPEALTSSAGLLAIRELDERLGFTRWLASKLEDSRQAGRVRHSLVELLRTRILATIAGFGAQRDVELLREDPALRLAISSRRGERALDLELASQPSLARFHRLLGSPSNLSALDDGVLELAIRSIEAMPGPFVPELTIDVDSTTIDTHGDQPGSVWNGHYRKKCLHPLVAMVAETGDILGGRLRPGNKSSSDGVIDFLGKILDRLQAAGQRVGWLRGDAGFTSDTMMCFLEERRVSYVFRVVRNKALERIAEPFIRRPPGRRPNEPREWVHEIPYKGKRWSKERRIILVVQENPDDLFLHHYFLVTDNEWMPAQRVLNHYRKRGTMEARLGEMKSTIDPKLSCSTRGKEVSAEDREAAFAANASTFAIQILAHGLMNALRRLTGSRLSADGMSRPALQRVRKLAIQIAGRVCRSGRRLTMVVASSSAMIWDFIGERLDRLLPLT